MVKNKPPADLTEQHLAYYEGSNTFEEWIGPSLPQNDPMYEELSNAIKKVLQSRNIIQETIDRHRRALVGKRPHWYFTDNLGDRTSSDAASDAEKILQRWIDLQYRQSSLDRRDQLQNSIAEATKNMLVTERGYLRLWSPTRFRNSPNPIARVYLHSPHPSSVVINSDGDGFTKSIEYTYIEDNRQRKEIQFIDPQSNKTIFFTLDESGQIVEDSEIQLDLGGRYSIYELRSPTLITDSVKRAQNAINYALTLMPRNLQEAGFRERLILGGQRPGNWDDDNNFTPDPDFKIGPGQTSFIQGAPVFDDAGQLRGYTNPSAVYSQPVDVKTFIDTALTFVAVVYHEMSQTHLLGSDLLLSGVSREQSRQDFESRLGEDADNVSAALAGIYGAALMMIVQDEPLFPQYKDLDVMVQLRLNATKPLPEERQENREDYKAGLRSRTTAMAHSGIDDPDSEQNLIENEERSRSAVDDASSLLTVGAIDQPQAIELLKRRGRLEADTTLTSGGSKDEVLNGNGTGTTV